MNQRIIGAKVHDATTSRLVFTQDRPFETPSKPHDQQPRHLDVLSGKDAMLQASLAARREASAYKTPEHALSPRRRIPPSEKLLRTRISLPAGDRTQIVPRFQALSPRKDRSKVTRISSDPNSPESSHQIVLNLRRRIQELDTRAAKSATYKHVSVRTSQGEQLKLCSLTRYSDTKRQTLKSIPPNGSQFLEEILCLSPSLKVLFSIGNVDISLHSIISIGASNHWLDDAAVNGFFKLLETRSKENILLPRIFTLNTFFYSFLQKNSTRSLSCISRQLSSSLQDLDMILIPIHLGNHWICVCVHLCNRLVCIFDSLSTFCGYVKPLSSSSIRSLSHACDKHVHIVSQIANFLNSHVFDTIIPWRFVIPGTLVPQQCNIDDCGVFTCLFADEAALRAETDPRAFSFCSDDINLLRRRIALELFIEQCFDDDSVREPLSQCRLDAIQAKLTSIDDDDPLESDSDIEIC